MKKNKIKILTLSLALMFTFTACTAKDKDMGYNTNKKLSTQTRDNRVTKDRNLTGTDTVRNENRDNLNMDNSMDRMDDVGINDSIDNNDMGLNNGLRDGLDTNINNGMTRPDMDKDTRMDNDNMNNTNNTGNTDNITKMNKNANNIAKKITDLKEVNKSNVLITEDRAIIGVNLRGDTQGTMTNDLKQKIEKMVKKEDSSIKDVSITTDPNLVTRINTMTTNIVDGTMMDTFAEDVKDLIRRITPKSMK